MQEIKRALISVSDKTGVVEFARELINFEYEIVSTGGTARTLRENGIPVTYISDVTKFPEILDGRVKTLHPKVHGGILARRSAEHLKELDENEIVPINIVAVNLYPFKETIARPGVTLEEAVENIDIGGPAMVRAAAKNNQYVVVVVNPAKYGDIINALKAGGVDAPLRMSLALEAFAHTAEYDSMIAGYLERQVRGETRFGENFFVRGGRLQKLRYGENPHQQAAFYADETAVPGTVGASRQLQGKELSFNNIVDLEAVLAAVKEFDAPAAVIAKHTNPCGAAVAASAAEAYEKALHADPVSAYGGIVGLNRELDVETASKLVNIFLEAVIAPAVSPEAQQILAEKPNLRVLECGGWDPGALSGFDIKKVSGGFLVQDLDAAADNEQEWQVVTAAKPSAEDLKELFFAWKVVKNVKSNAIVVAKGGATLGVGAGQMNRVGAAKIALEAAGSACRGAYLASDAFFPFSDTVSLAAEAGIKAIVQPGGSVRDEDSIREADARGMVMVFTGKRHFKH